MEILSTSGVWVDAIIDGRWVEAKVFDEGSEYGINGGRISILSISKTGKRDPNRNFEAQMCYNYVRGEVTVESIDDELLNSIVAQLETLPKFKNSGE